MSDETIYWNEMYAAAEELRRPFIQLRPRLFIDGDKWCALYGDNLMEGVMGSGESPELAAWDFDKKFCEKLPSAPAAIPFSARTNVPRHTGYEPDCADCPDKEGCRAAGRCNVMQNLRPSRVTNNQISTSENPNNSLRQQWEIGDITDPDAALAALNRIDLLERELADLQKAFDAQAKTCDHYYEQWGLAQTLARPATTTCSTCGAAEGEPCRGNCERRTFPPTAHVMPVWQKVGSYADACDRFGGDGVRSDQHATCFVYRVDENRQWWAMPLPLFNEQAQQIMRDALPSLARSCTANVEEIARLREIEHMAWHVLEGGEERVSDSEFALDLPNEDYEKLCALLGDAHSEPYTGAPQPVTGDALAVALKALGESNERAQVLQAVVDDTLARSATSLGEDTKRRAEATMLLLDSPLWTDAGAERAFWRGRARYLAEAILRAADRRAT